MIFAINFACAAFLCYIIWIKKQKLSLVLKYCVFALAKIYIKILKFFQKGIDTEKKWCILANVNSKGAVSLVLTVLSFFTLRYCRVKRKK